MKPQSAKAKGRKLQNEVVALILALFDELAPDDVTSRSMGSSGEDILLSPKARKLLGGMSFECKYTERLNVWGALAQAEANAPETGTPVLVFRRNRSETYAALPLRDLLLLRLALVIAREDWTTALEKLI